jgi:NAD(P)-dependent dehydrogenase (short-subunit alcohol dehydrogenase family)
MSTDDRVVIVTGGGGKGCGRAIASRFAATGAVVVVSDIDDAAGRETVAAIERARGRAAYCRADVRSRDDARELVAFAETTFGGLDVLVNNASSLTDQPDIEHWIDALETDLLGAMHTTRWAIDAMRRSGGGGAIVNIASISALWHGRRTPGGFAGYDVAKAGMIRMTTRLAPLAETDGIRVNCLAPGWIATEGPREYWESLTLEQRAERGVPARLLATSEIAAAVMRLADDRTLAGRVLVWWSDDAPGLIPWGDRGYRDLDIVNLESGLK